MDDSKITIASSADYAREHYIFQRAQSPVMRNTPWHSPRRPVFVNVNWGVIGAFAVCALILLLVAVRVS